MWLNRSFDLDSEKRKFKEDLAWLKQLFVPPTYDSSKLLQSGMDQIRRLYQPTKQIKACKTALESQEIVAWRENSAENGAKTPPKIVWVISQTRDITISHITLELLQILAVSTEKSHQKHTPITLHSLLLDTDELRDGKRTACTLLKEAIFQLLLQVPDLLRESQSLQELCYKGSPLTPAPKDEGGLSFLDNDLGLNKLHQIMQELLDACRAPPTGCSTTSDEQDPFLLANLSSPQESFSRPPLIFWIVDRIDTCFSDSKEYRKAPKLTEFAEVLEKLVTRGASYEGGKMGRFRVLMTSIYEPVSIDEDFQACEEGAKGDEERDVTRHGGLQKKPERVGAWQMLFA
jgi:hypothetical protein